MKINWGTRIFILYSGFVVLILFLVYRSFKTDVNLVAENYYEKEKEYDALYTAMENYRMLTDTLKVMMEDEGVYISLPFMPEDTLGSPKVSGTLHFFRPSGSEHDILDSFIWNNRPLFYPRERFINGKYLLWVKWQVGEKMYYTNSNLYLP
jgi:hypothetical protein